LHGKEIPFCVASPLSLDTLVTSDKDVEDERSPLAANGGPAQGGLHSVQNDNAADAA
jgi:hypothetical protein